MLPPSLCQNGIDITYGQHESVKKTKVGWRLKKSVISSRMYHPYSYDNLLRSSVRHVSRRCAGAVCYCFESDIVCTHAQKLLLDHKNVARSQYYSHAICVPIRFHVVNINVHKSLIRIHSFVQHCANRVQRTSTPL